jgi:hypothetical protein
VENVPLDIVVACGLVTLRGATFRCATFRGLLAEAMALYVAFACALDVAFACPLRVALTVSI